MQHCKQHRRNFVKGLTCYHKHHPEADVQLYWICDKNGKECLVEGQCPENCGHKK